MPAELTHQPELLHLSMVIGAPLRDADGARLGRVEDLLVRLEEVGYPPITGFLVKVAGRHSYLAADSVVLIDQRGVTLRKAKLDLRPFEQRPEEVLLKADVLDHQLIDVDGARLIRANEVELARLEGWWRVVGVDTGPRGGIRRLLPRVIGRRVATGGFLDWASVEPFVGEVPSLQLRVPHSKLVKLHPAQIADLVEAASHIQGEEIIRAVGDDDRELEADVFEELDEQHQLEFIEQRSDQQVAQVLTRMAPDDAADLAAELDDDRREAVISLLPASRRSKVRVLLGYDPAEAGGLMSTDFLCMYQNALVEEAWERLRQSPISADLITSVFVMDTARRLKGSLPLAELIRAKPDAQLVELVARDTPRLVADAEFEEVARLMADFNLTSAPVVDAEMRMIGVITVDDVLEVMLPKGWQRRFGLFGDS